MSWQFTSHLPAIGRTLSLALALPLASCSGGRPSKDSLTILLTGDIRGLDPNEEVETLTDSVLFNVFEPLVGLDENLEIRRMLAESWEHPRPEQWRFHLRRNVRFHDGTPLTAKLVRDALLGVQQASQLEASDFLSQVQEIVAVDDETVDLVTREPRGILANLPVVYVSKPNSNGPFPPLVGTGPYTIREWKRGEGVTLERWPGYWGTRPEFPRAVFVPLPDPRARLARLREGTADIMYDVPPDLASQEMPGIRFLRRQGVTVWYVGFNLRKRPGNPFEDLRVRKAFHLAVDRQAIAQGYLKGYGTISTQPVPPTVFGYHPGLPVPEYDPVRARELMIQAGHAKGFGVRLDVSRGRRAAADFVREALREIGVEVDVNAVAAHELYDLAKEGRSDLFLVGWNFSSGEASEFFEFCLHTPTIRYGFNNYGLYSNPTIDEIAETNAAILDPRKRRKRLEEAAAIAMEDLPVLPLYVSDDVYAVREPLLFAPRADSEIRLLDVRRAPR